MLKQIFKPSFHVIWAITKNEPIKKCGQGWVKAVLILLLTGSKKMEEVLLKW